MSEPKIQLVWRKIDELIPYEHNAKLHPQEQIDKLVGSFDEFGRIVPAGIDRDGNLIYGHGRILAARQRGDTDFPCIEIDGLSETQRRAFVHADNLLAESGTDQEILRAEMQALQAAGFDVTITGYDPSGLTIGDTQKKEIVEDNFDEEPPEEPRTKRGQVWQLGDHRLMCGDATSAEDVHVCAGGGRFPACLPTRRMAWIIVLLVEASKNALSKTTRKKAPSFKNSCSARSPPPRRQWSRAPFTMFLARRGLTRKSSMQL